MTKRAAFLSKGRTKQQIIAMGPKIGDIHKNDLNGEDYKVSFNIYRGQSSVIGPKRGKLGLVKVFNRPAGTNCGVSGTIPQLKEMKTWLSYTKIRASDEPGSEFINTFRICQPRSVAQNKHSTDLKTLITRMNSVPGSIKIAGIDLESGKKRTGIAGTWSIAAVDFETGAPLIQTQQTSRRYKTSVGHEALAHFAEKMREFEADGWIFVGHGDDIVKFGEFAKLTSPVLNGELALKSVFQTCKPSAENKGSLSLTYLIPAFGIRDKEAHASEEDSVDMLRVYKALFTDPRMRQFAKQ